MDSESYLNAEQKVKKARKYVENLHINTGGSGNDDADLVSKRLKQDVLETKGKLGKVLTNDFHGVEVIKVIRKHKAAVTSTIISKDSLFLYSACKEGLVIEYNMNSGEQVSKISLNTSCMCLALSSDGKCLAAGTSKGELVIMDTQCLKITKSFSAHRGAVNGLSFRVDSHQLFSVGSDKLLKVWEPDHGGFIEVLCGHTEAITCISCLSRERPLTAGGKDASLRIWKFVEESQLVYNISSPGVCIDCCAYIDDSHFLSGSTDGSLCVWTVNNKSPIYTVKNAHGSLGASSWIASLATCPYSDIACSGAADGFARLWRIDGSQNFKKLIQMSAIPIPGSINAMSFSHDGKLLVIGVGREHKFGRWSVIKKAKNAVFIIRLS